ncbi:MAG: hypothetical protein ACD_76C00094G0005 [uncultured bacterium]|nr:MAG: hypothetical protein ACD_76C00094G0005 [uncultured bacterium]HBD05260.1 hypothetical protein [Candidatus Uhrbacteria bacterium]
MDNQWKRVLRLIQQTGDKLIVLSENSDAAYVVMPLEAYEATVADSVSEKVQQPVVSQNKEIAKVSQKTVWDSLKKPNEVEEPELPELPEIGKNEPKNDFPDEDQFYLEPVE